MTTTNRRRFAKRLAASLGALTVAPTPAHPASNADPMTPTCREAFAALPAKQQALVVQAIALLAIARDPVPAGVRAAFFTPAQLAAHRQSERELDALLAARGGAR